MYIVDDSYRPGGIRAVVNDHRWVENTLEEEVFGAKMPNFDILRAKRPKLEREKALLPNFAEKVSWRFGVITKYLILTSLAKSSQLICLGI